MIDEDNKNIEDDFLENDDDKNSSLDDIDPKEKSTKKILALDISGEDHPLFLKKLKDSGIELYPEGAKINDDCKYIIVGENRPEFSDLSFQYETVEKSRELVSLSRVLNRVEFISNNGRAIIAPQWLEFPAGKRLIQRYFDKKTSIHLNEFYGNIFDNYNTYKVINHIRAGHITDLISSLALEGDFNIVSIRNFVTNIIYYLTYLKQKNVATIPFEIEVGHNGDEFVCQIISSLTSKDFFIEYILGSFEQGNFSSPLRFLLGETFQQCPFFDVYYLRSSSKLVITGLWGSEKNNEKLGFNTLQISNIPSASQVEDEIENNLSNVNLAYERKIEEIKEELINKQLPGEAFQRISLTAKDSIFTTNPEIFNALIVHIVEERVEEDNPVPLPELVSEHINDYLDTFPNQEIIKKIKKGERQQILEFMHDQNAIAKILEVLNQKKQEISEMEVIDPEMLDKLKEGLLNSLQAQGVGAEDPLEQASIEENLSFEHETEDGNKVISTKEIEDNIIKIGHTVTNDEGVEIVSATQEIDPTDGKKTVTTKTKDQRNNPITITTQFIDENRKVTKTEQIDEQGNEVITTQIINDDNTYEVIQEKISETGEKEVKNEKLDLSEFEDQDLAQKSLADLLGALNLDEKGIPVGENIKLDDTGLPEGTISEDDTSLNEFLSSAGDSDKFVVKGSGQQDDTSVLVNGGAKNNDQAQTVKGSKEQVPENITVKGTGGNSPEENFKIKGGGPQDSKGSMNVVNSDGSTGDEKGKFNVKNSPTSIADEKGKFNVKLGGDGSAEKEEINRIKSTPLSTTSDEVKISGKNASGHDSWEVKSLATGGQDEIGNLANDLDSQLGISEKSLGQDEKVVISGKPDLSTDDKIIVSSKEESSQAPLNEGPKIDGDLLAKISTFISNEMGHLPKGVKVSELADNLAKKASDVLKVDYSIVFPIVEHGIKETQRELARQATVKSTTESMAGIEDIAKEARYLDEIRKKDKELEHLKNQLGVVNAGLEAERAASKSMQEAEKVSASSLDEKSEILENSAILQIEKANSEISNVLDNLDPSRPLNPEELEKLKSAMQSSHEASNVAKQFEMELKKTETSYRAKANFLTSEIKKSQREAKSKDLINLKLKESMARAMDLKEKKLAEQNQRLDELQAKLAEAGQDEIKFQFKRALKDKENLEKQLEIYKRKLSNMADSLNNLQNRGKHSSGQNLEKELARFKAKEDRMKQVLQNNAKDKDLSMKKIKEMQAMLEKSKVLLKQKDEEFRTKERNLGQQIADSNNAKPEALTSPSANDLNNNLKLENEKLEKQLAKMKHELDLAKSIQASAPSTTQVKSDAANSNSVPGPSLDALEEEVKLMKEKFSKDKSALEQVNAILKNDLESAKRQLEMAQAAAKTSAAGGGGGSARATGELREANVLLESQVKEMTKKMNEANVEAKQGQIKIKELEHKLKIASMKGSSGGGASTSNDKSKAESGGKAGGADVKAVEQKAKQQIGQLERKIENMTVLISKSSSELSEIKKTNAKMKQTETGHKNTIEKLTKELERLKQGKKKAA